MVKNMIDSANIKWEEIARNILKKEDITNILAHPKFMSANIYWKDDFYIGSVQEIVPEFSKEVVLLSKSSEHYPEELAQALRKLDSVRLDLFAEYNLDLEGRQHVVRKIGDKLMHMTTEQTKFMASFPMEIFEIT